jgi:endonuclease/exonuclease/phosphatase family metal-dependent hydrolase
MARKNYFSFSMLFMLLVSFNWLPDDPVEDFSVMSFNVLFKNFDLEATTSVLEQANADIIGLQEVQPFALSYLAKQMGYQMVHLPDNPAALHANDTGILTRFPVVEWLPFGVVVELSRGRYLGVLNVHLPPFPYEPFGIRDRKFKTPEEVIASSESHRLPVLEEVLHTVRALQNRSIPVCLLGDFNEPSHLDWTPRAASVGQHFGWSVPFPVSVRLQEAGFVDTYRCHFPDELAFPGHTWSPESSEEGADRIDYIYLRGGAVEPVHSEVLGPDDFPAMKEAGRFPSDHEAVVTHLLWRETI